VLYIAILLCKRLDHENEIMAGTVKLLEHASNSKENDDTYNTLVLHSKINHLNEHNRSLQEELNNLKSAVFTDFLKPNQRFQHFNQSTSSSLTDVSYVNDEKSNQLSESISSHSNCHNSLKLNNKTKISINNPKNMKCEIVEEDCSSNSFDSVSFASCSSAKPSFQSQLNRDEEEIESKLEKLITTFERIEEKEEEKEQELEDFLKIVGGKFESYLDVALQLSQSLH